MSSVGHLMDASDSEIRSYLRTYRLIGPDKMMALFPKETERKWLENFYVVIEDAFASLIAKARFARQNYSGEQLFDHFIRLDAGCVYLLSLMGGLGRRVTLEDEEWQKELDCIMESSEIAMQFVQECDPQILFWEQKVQLEGVYK